jgi:spermidine synthase
VQDLRPPSIRRILFFLFFVSGFCGLLYQVIWTRIAFAAFGIITPVLSVVLSVFMLGLALGSAAGGKWIPALTRKTGLSAAFFYGLAEGLIGVGAFAVPKLFDLGGRVLLPAGEMNSFGYLSLSALVLALSILPWCFFMGTTFPFMMAYIREREERDAQSFSFLYVANVLGAMSGTILTALVFIELFGFHHTLLVAAAGNFIIALISIWLGARQRELAAGRGQPAPATPGDAKGPTRPRAPLLRWILFTTGFCAMAMEVVWTRAFTPVLKTQVYSFALIVFTYLGATFAGSLWYRHHLKKNSSWPVSALMAILVATVFLPIVVNDPRWLKMMWAQPMDGWSAVILLAGICPFCAALGYLTPGLVDDYAGGDPTRAGNAYAINVCGCILGPLFASYLLLPHISEQAALVILGLPFFAFYLAGWKSLPQMQRAVSVVGTAVVVCLTFLAHNFLDLAAASSSTHMEVRRDYAASVVSLEDTNELKHLLVNGIGMTSLTPITKFMVDLPLALHQGDSQSALIICFGMGTSYRTALTWGLDTTAVELIPDVPQAFGFYYDDAPEVLHDPHGRIVIDDGRRFLKRTHDQYDLIVVDPPPPLEAAGTSLLYSREMCELLKQHLKPHGIAQIWFPGGEALVGQAVIRSAYATFPHVRCFLSVSGWGIHILASEDPIVMQPAAQLASRLPEAAKKNLVEWWPSVDVTNYMGIVLARELAVTKLLDPNPRIQITDDQPLNEYFILRRNHLYHPEFVGLP